MRREQEQWEERVEAAPRLIPDQEKLLAALKQLFHPNHNLCMDVMFNLASTSVWGEGEQGRGLGVRGGEEGEDVQGAALHHGAGHPGGL